MEERWCRCTVARRGRGGGHKRRNCIGPARWLDFNRSATYKVAENQIIPARPVPHPPPLATSFSLPPSLPPYPPLLDLYFPVGHDCEPFFFPFLFFFFPLPSPHPRFFISRIFIDSCKSNVRYPPLRRGRANSKPRLELEEGEESLSLSLTDRTSTIKIGIARDHFFSLLSPSCLPLPTP